MDTCFQDAAEPKTQIWGHRLYSTMNSSYLCCSPVHALGLYRVLGPALGVSNFAETLQTYDFSQGLSSGCCLLLSTIL